MKKEYLEEKAVTLVALIITVVLLLIIASTTISQTTQANGIVSKTNEAEKEYNLALEKKELKEKVLKWQLTNKNGIPTLYNFFIQIYGTENIQENEDNSVTITLSNGRKYNVTESTEVTLLNN